MLSCDLQDAPGGGVTAGLMTARTVCRIIVRDLCGKYCWENSVLYSPPWCTKGSSRHSKWGEARAVCVVVVFKNLIPLFNFKTGYIWGCFIRCFSKDFLKTCLFPF